MCLIVDINVAHRVITDSNDPDFKDLHSCIFYGKPRNVRLVYGGRLAKEYSKNYSMMRLILQLDRKGRARTVPDNLVEDETERLEKSQLCCSNDQHIIALAIVSNVRLLCSHDQSLHSDFTNRALLNNPRGKVYQNSNHNHLLVRHC